MIMIQGLRVIYKPTGIEALRNINVEIPGNTVTCIIGPNASGKTTLLKAIARLVEYDGKVFVENREISEWGKVLRKILAYSSYINVNELLGVRVIDVLISSRYPVSQGLADTEEDYKTVHWVARSLNIEHLLHRKLNELSSGERQRVILASALVRSPKILLLDEPDNHLDVASKPWLSHYLKELSERCTVVLSTHDVIFAFNTCNYFVVLSHGRLVYSGFSRDLLENAKFLEYAYGVKFTRIDIQNSSMLVPVYRILGTDINK